MGMRVKNFDNPNWRPLEKLIGSRCAQFMWMGREGELECYKHIDTRRYIHLDSKGRCFREGPEGLEPANLDEELKRVFE
jgi:hypothetical protein